jgi:hypothetical protein
MWDAPVPDIVVWELAATTLVDVTAGRLIARASTYACGSGHHCVVVEEIKMRS